MSAPRIPDEWFNGVPGREPGEWSVYVPALAYDPASWPPTGRAWPADLQHTVSVPAATEWEAKSQAHALSMRYGFAAAVHYKRGVELVFVNGAPYVRRD